METVEQRVGMMIENGRSGRNVGFRQVCFSPEGVIRPVETAKRNGMFKFRCTKQAGKEGDNVIRVSWYPLKYSLFVIRNGALIHVYDLQTNLHPFAVYAKAYVELLTSWLVPTVEGESYLPADCGWDGKNTAYDLRKDDRVRKFFAGLRQSWVENLVHVARVSPGKSLQLNWKEAAPLPKLVEATVEEYRQHGIQIHRSQEWIFWFYDGSVEFSGHQPTDVVTDSSTMSFKPLPFPDDVERAARIRFNCYTNEQGVPYGVAWELYSRSLE